MSETDQPVARAWQPFTPRGLARFVHASTNRLLVIQIISACLVAGTIIWFLGSCYAPVISRAVERLPEKAGISKQQLSGLEPGTLAEDRFLSIGVESFESPFAGVGDLQLRIGTSQLNICSLMGCAEIFYPAGWSISLDRASVEPRWGAWKPMLLGGVGLFAAIFLLLSWMILALVSFWVPKVVAFYADRELTWSGSWKIACAAPLPGAFFAAFVIFLYGMGALDLIRFLILFAFHLPIDLIYLSLAPFSLPKVPDRIVAKNPFGTEEVQ